MSFTDHMHSYFRGEKMEALFFILPVGLALIILGIVALRAESGGFAWGVAIPSFLFGLVLASAGIGVGIRTNSQVADIENRYAENPTALAEAELERITKVNKNFRLTFISFGILAAIGLAIHYLGGADLGRGLGSALLLISALGLLVDGFAERRAEPYTRVLEKEITPD